jgi:hypothetical protein
MSSFKYLSNAEFESLNSSEKLVYLSDAMEELERAKVPRAVRGWHSLFSRTQQQQQEQPQDDQQPDTPRDPKQPD